MKLVSYIIVAAVLIAVCGCRSAEAEKKEIYPVIAPLDRKSADELRQRAEVFAQAMARSFRTGDFSFWRAALEKEGPPGRPLVVDEKKFLQMYSRLKKDWERSRRAPIWVSWTRRCCGIFYGSVPSSSGKAPAKSVVSKSSSSCAVPCSEVKQCSPISVSGSSTGRSTARG